jgi:hypothetical protein
MWLGVISGCMCLWRLHKLIGDKVAKRVRNELKVGVA